MKTTDIKKQIINTVNHYTKEDRKYINDRTLKVTDKFQKKFNLEKRDKKGNEYWNNECDAFKHAYMQAYMTISQNKFYAWGAGAYHEMEGRTYNQPAGEERMDTHNNKIGRDIGNKIKKEFGKKWNNLSEDTKDNIIGVKIIEKMQKGELITRPDGSRSYNGKKVNSEKIQQYINKKILNKSEKSYSEKFSNEIREKYKQMVQSRNRILANRKNSNINYSDGHWVTINGNHVLINS